MRLRPAGPDIPDQLISLQEKGQVIFVCGAGISRGAGLPLFRGLVEGVYQHLNEDWRLHLAEREVMEVGGQLYGQYDRGLRCLERRLIGSDLARQRGMRTRIRSAIDRLLAAPDNADLRDHLALLELSRDSEGGSRLITTNFDTLFERAWFEKIGNPIPTHAGIAMPQPKTAGFTGVLHLHGRLNDPRKELNANSTDLVLTSAEFGDAYLRLGWASRYIYDLVRTHTVVLVGYQADDPPMRYLLEAMEADRERYTDLHEVFAFAPSEKDNQELTSAIWRAKGVEPILYEAENGSHSVLYETVREWRDYANDPSNWRLEQLRPILVRDPAACTEEEVARCVHLLSHGDANQLLADISPAASWLPVLVERKTFDAGSTLRLPGAWIAGNMNDHGMISACAGLQVFDDWTEALLRQGCERGRDNISSLRRKAWHLLLAAKRKRDGSNLRGDWYLALPSINRGIADFAMRQAVVGVIRPRLKIGRPWITAQRSSTSEEAMDHLIRLDFIAPDYPSANDILAAWPQNLAGQKSLFETLSSALFEALEEAEDAGFLQPYDRASHDVPSIAQHLQNAHRSGFYPIVAAIAGLWSKIADHDPRLAQQLASRWGESTHLLICRLSLFAHTHSAFTPREAAALVMSLKDETFWIGDAQVEIMRLLSDRWGEFDEDDKAKIEERLCRGIPRNLFELPLDDTEWQSVLDSKIFRRICRIKSAGGKLAEVTEHVLRDIAQRHPNWTPRLGDRDDFPVWIESGWGPQGHPDRLAELTDDKLVQEALRLEREQHFEEDDIWRMFCGADPQRALRGLRSEAEEGSWNRYAWRCLLGAATEKEENDLQFVLADCLLEMPRESLVALLQPASSWLNRKRKVLSESGGDALFLRLWDRFAEHAFGPLVIEDGGTSHIQNLDVLTESLNAPGGILAWALLEALEASRPDELDLPEKYKPRFELVLDAPGRDGFLGRVYLGRFLPYLFSIAWEWTREKFLPLMSWTKPEAPALWQSYALGPGIGNAVLFNALKPNILIAFSRDDMPNEALEGLGARLLSIGLAHRRAEAVEYELSSDELKYTLTVGPASVRQNISWNFYRCMGDAAGIPENKGNRWREVIGPLFQEIWPLDAEFREASSTRNFVLMALECDNAFPEAVDAILDFVVPHQIYQISHELRLEPHHEDLVFRFPRDVLRLANALLDPKAFSIPNDLASLLQACLDADPSLVRDAIYIRLNGLSRLGSA